PSGSWLRARSILSAGTNGRARSRRKKHGESRGPTTTSRPLDRRPGPWSNRARARRFTRAGRGVMTKRHLLRYESRHRPVASRGTFLKRLARNFAVASLLIGLSLLGGMLGYHLTEGMDWLDSFANAAMILSGMGPLEPLHTPAGKVFAGCYALYS